MPEIILSNRWNGGTGALQGAGRRGRESRIAQVRRTFDHLPAWKCESMACLPSGQPVYRYYLCGRCFARRGDGPGRTLSEMWTAGDPLGSLIPKDALCADCGGRAWPAD
jgi:hypothetical protein